MEEFLTQYSKDIITTVSLIFGAFSLLGYLSQRKANKKNEALLKWAEISVDKSITTKEVQHLKATKEKYEKEVQNKIPNLAAIRVLDNQVKFYESEIAKNYDNLNAINNQLNQLTIGSEHKISYELKEKINRELVTERRIRKIRSSILDKILVLFGALLLIPFYPVNLFSGAFLMILFIVYFTINSPIERIRNENYKLVEYGFSILCLLLFLTIGYALFVLWERSEWLIKGSLILFMIGSVGLIFIRKYVIKTFFENYEKKINE